MMKQNIELSKTPLPSSWIVLFLILVVIITVFSKSLDNGLVSLDDTEILSQPMIRSFFFRKFQRNDY
jgi:hypothetical protein